MLCEVGRANKGSPVKKVVIIGIFIAAYWLWSSDQLPFQSNNKNPAADVSANVVTLIFTFDGCGDACINSVKELQRRHVPFTEKVVHPERPDEPDFKLWQSYATDNAFPLLVIGDQTTTGFHVPIIASLLGKSFGELYLTSNEKRYFKSHFNADGTPRIVLYGTEWCPYCAKLRKELRSNQVSFEDIDVEKRSDTNQLLQTMGITFYPATWVGYTRVKNASDFNAIMALVQQSK
jgi:glutaredoxin